MAQSKKYTPFNNPVTFSILMVLVTLIGFGAIELFFGKILIGGICFVGGVILMMVGFEDHPLEPLTYGVLTCWDVPIRFFGKYYVVGGRTIVANYFPFFISTVKINMTLADKDIPVTVVSKDEVYMSGKISVTLEPDPENPVEFFRSCGGNIQLIFEQIDDIIVEDSKKIAKKHDSSDIAHEPDIISGPLRKKLQKIKDGTPDIFEGRSFGVIIRKVQGNFEDPEDLKEAKRGETIERFQRKNELAEYETNLLAAKKMFEELNAAGEKVTLSECQTRIRDQRLIRDGEYTKIDAPAGLVLTRADKKEKKK